MKKTTHTRISATLSKALLAQIDVLVKTSGYSNRSVLIEDALEDFLKLKTGTGSRTEAAEPAASPASEPTTSEAVKPSE